MILYFTKYIVYINTLLDNEFLFQNIAYFYISMSFVCHYIITSQLNDKKNREK